MLKVLVLLAMGMSWVVGQPASRGVSVIRAHKKCALVIGNSDYKLGRLANPANDAKALASELRKLGFEVDQVVDADRKKMRQAVDGFTEKLGPGDVALFYYAGHGVELNGKNYLVPVDFDGKNAQDAEDDAFPANKVQSGMEQSGSQLNIIILDACRNNPFPAAHRGLGRGLAQMSGGAAGTYIAFATAPGQTASDNEKEANGLFTKHLLQALQQPGLSLDSVFRQVRNGVKESSGNAQVPWSQDATIGEFYFTAGTASTAGLANPLAPDSTKILHISEFTADRTEITTRDLVRFHVKVTDPLADPLQYTWSTSAGRLEPRGDSAELSASGMRGLSAPEKIAVTVTARNSRGEVDYKTLEVTVRNTPDANTGPVVGRIWADGQDVMLTLESKVSPPAAPTALSVEMENVDGTPRIAKIDGGLPGFPAVLLVSGAVNCRVAQVIEPLSASNNWMRLRLRLQPDDARQPMKLTLGYLSVTPKDKKGKK